MKNGVNALKFLEKFIFVRNPESKKSKRNNLQVKKKNKMAPMMKGIKRKQM
jgi:hypothetical protein